MSIDFALEQIRNSSKKRGGLGLDRMKRLLELLGNPESRLKVIHIAGTNGKGSIGRFIFHILRESGYNVAIYTSPHLEKYNERFEINGEYISDEEFTDLTNEIVKMNPILENEGFGYLSEFEILTAIAYIYFSRKAPDFTILETGIGGRIDMTNVIEKPLITIISEIGFDHTAALGNTIPQIAYQKAGIIKNQVPIVSGTTDGEARQVIAGVAKAKDADMIDASAGKYEIKNIFPVTEFKAHIAGIEETEFRIGLLGEHQIRNAITSICSILELKRRNIINASSKKILRGLEKTKNPGRFEIISTEPYVILDGAHNMQGVEQAMNAFEYAIKRIRPTKIAIIYGCFIDKEYEKIAKHISKTCDKINVDKIDIIVTEPESDRALGSSRLADIFRKYGIAARSIPKPVDAAKTAISEGNNIILFLGSIYLIGEVRKFFKKGWKENV